MTFLIRAASAEDAAVIASIYAPYVENHSISFEELAPSPEEMAGRIAGIAADGLPWLVAESDGEIVGYAYARRFHERHAYRFAVETSLYVSAGRQREGIGRQLYIALIRTLSAQGYTQALALIAMPNDASIAMHETVGFRRAGVWRSVGYKHGAWRDVAIWQRALAAMEDEPAEPRSFAEIGLVPG